MPIILSTIALLVVAGAVLALGFFALPALVVLLLLGLVGVAGFRVFRRVGPRPAKPVSPAETPAPTPGAARRRG